MRDFKKRRTLGSELTWMTLGFFGLVALALLAFVAARAAWGMYGKFAAAAAARANAEAQLSELQARLAQVQKDVESLSSERGLEAAIRERYGVARPGEGEIAIVRPATSSEPARRPQGFLSGLWDMLFVW